MRDFRDAKAMARTLRAALATKGLKIAISQSLELIAEVFGVADRNTLAAAIRGGSTVRRDDVSPSKPPRAETGPTQGVMFCVHLSRHFIRPSLTLTNEITSTRRWSISCSL
jgi:hypothetical protein